MKRFFLIIPLLFLTNILFSQNIQEYYFKFDIKDKAEIEELTQIISIDNVINNTVFAYATESKLQDLLSLGYQVTFLNQTTKSQRSDPATTIAEMQNWDKYPTYGLYAEMMENYADSYPEICKLINIGSTVLGRDLLVLKISDDIDTEEDEPEIFLSSTIHGDETLGFIFMLRLIDSLVKNYASNDDISALVNGTEIYINPNANPDGTYQSDDNTIVNPKRFNANGIDINRNFPDPEDGNHPNGEAWQPETESMMEFAKEHNFVLSANFHCGAELVNYPWDTWYRRHPDDEWFYGISRNYATSLQNNSPSGYFTDLDNGVTNGYDWYPISGGRQDYFTYFHHSREITIELSTEKHIEDALLPTFWNYNKEALFQFLNESLYGIRGIVSDTAGNPLKAMIYIDNHDSTEDSSMVFTDPEIGDYHRLIEPGTYDIIASANGYANDTIKNVMVSTKSIAYANFVLLPGESTPVGVDVQTIVGFESKIYPNPFCNELNIRIYSEKNQNIELGIYKTTGERIFYRSIPVRQGDNVFSISEKLNLTQYSSGIYYLQLISADINSSFTIVKL